MNKDVNKDILELKKNFKKIDLYKAFKVNKLEDITEEDIKNYANLLVSTYYAVKEEI